MLKVVRRSLVFAMILVFSASAALAAPDVYKIDAGHSSIGFSVRHLVSKTYGRFNKFNGSITMDAADPKSAVVDLTIEAGSINTDHEKRDGHLKSADFFGVDSFPQITFRSTEVRPADAESGTLVGDLTMKGITKSVELQYTILGMLSGGSKMLGVEATGTINRKDFNVLWNRDLDDGKTVLGDEVAITIAIEAKTEAPKPPAAKTN
jgi:polyisoprenoid-binding protein YceI